MLNLDAATVIFQIINFLIFFGLLYWLLFKPMTATIKQRRQQQERMLREVERERQAVSVQRAELDERLSRLDEESVSVIALARERAEEERRALLQEGREEVEHILVEALPAGRYYIHVSNASGTGSTQWYHVQAVYQ